jgi:hypothetical protein
LGRVEISPRLFPARYTQSDPAVADRTAHLHSPPVPNGSIRLHCLGADLNRNYKGHSVIGCDNSVRKGDELGWFEHGSTIIAFAPEGFALCDNIHDGAAIRMGEPLMRLP